MHAVGNDPFVNTKFRMLSVVAAGGTARVYRVENVELGRQYIAKMLLAHLGEDEKFRERLRREARLAARLRHANLVEVFDIDYADNELPFFLMECLEGQTLGEELRSRGRLPSLEALTYAREVLAGLQAAHDFGIVHRDIKPANVFLEERAEGRRVKLFDWGFAKFQDAARSSLSEDPATPLQMLTEEGDYVGTPEYMAPEQAKGEPVDSRADVYSVGVLLYEMLSGSRPFDINTEANHGPLLIPPSTRTGGAVPELLDPVVLRALAEDPRRRYQSAAEFAQALEEAARRIRIRGQLRPRWGVFALSGLIACVLWYSVLTVLWRW